jgi:hypothetical protein
VQTRTKGAFDALLASKAAAGNEEVIVKAYGNLFPVRRAIASAALHVRSRATPQMFFISAASANVLFCVACFSLGVT